ncbi:MAG: hypothetical protein H8E37_11445, partial [Planctomycetes bacterium]|nr:hypothetical protein [Planctomycetota bacterium]
MLLKQRVNFAELHQRRNQFPFDNAIGTDFRQLVIVVRHHAQQIRPHGRQPRKVLQIVADPGQPSDRQMRLMKLLPRDRASLLLGPPGLVKQEAGDRDDDENRSRQARGNPLCFLKSSQPRIVLILRRSNLRKQLRVLLVSLVELLTREVEVASRERRLSVGQLRGESMLPCLFIFR